MIPDDDSKADRKCRRKLGVIAWERELRAEILKLGELIREMEAGRISPFDVNDRIHEFHNGISRELWGRYSQSDPRESVYRAHYDGYLTEDDLADATVGVRDGIRHFTALQDDRRDCNSPPKQE